MADSKLRIALLTESNDFTSMVNTSLDSNLYELSSFIKIGELKNQIHDHPDTAAVILTHSNEDVSLQTQTMNFLRSYSKNSKTQTPIVVIYPLSCKNSLSEYKNYTNICFSEADVSGDSLAQAMENVRLMNVRNESYRHALKLFNKNLGNGDYEKADVLLMTTICNFVSPDELALFQADLSFRRGNVDQAISTATESTSSPLPSVRARAYYCLGRYYVSVGRIYDAIEMWQKEKKDRPMTADTHRRLGELYGAEGYAELSFESHESAFTLDPSSPKVQTGYILALLAEGKVNEATAIFNDCDPDQTVVKSLNTRAVILAKSQNPREAVSTYEIILRLISSKNTYKHIVLYNLALSHLRLSEVDAAEEALMKSLTQNPRFKKAQALRETIARIKSGLTPRWAEDEFSYISSANKLKLLGEECWDDDDVDLIEESIKTHELDRSKILSNVSHHNAAAADERPVAQAGGAPDPEENGGDYIIL